MSAREQDGASLLRASFNSLKPFEAFRVEAEDKTIIVACVERATFGITCWWKEANLEMRLQEVFREEGLEIRRARQNQQGRNSIATVVNGVEQGEVVVMRIARFFNMPLRPSSILPMVMNSPLDLD
jgi:hypothetical protein